MLRPTTETILMIVIALVVVVALIASCLADQSPLTIVGGVEIRMEIKER